MSDVRWGALVTLLVLAPITVYLFRNREDSEWNRTQSYVGIFMIVVFLFVLIFDPAPR
jgi:hypothetical protein